MSSPDFSNVFSRSVVLYRFLFLVWLFFVAEFIYGYQLHHFGIHPRNVLGLTGVITAPLLHVNLAHIVSNTIPLLILGSALFYFYSKSARRVFLASYFLPGIIVWIVGRPVNHIGASGLIYAFATYLVVIALLKRNAWSLAIAVVVALIYSGLFLGLTSTLNEVSYELHISGAIVGVGLAIHTFWMEKKRDK